MKSMYLQLMQLPLFQGVSGDLLSTLVEKLPFHFLKYRDGERIIASGDVCTHLRFVVSGQVRLSTDVHHLRVCLSQTLSAPNVLAPEFLFGRDTVYPFTAAAQGTCGILQLLKSDYVKILQADKVFLFNILNYLSLNTQKFTSSLLSHRRGSVAERLAIVVESLTCNGATDVVLNYRQKDLCTLMGAQRTTMLHALDRLVERGLIEYTASEMRIKDLRAFMQAQQ